MNRRQLLLSGAALIGCKGATPTDSDTDLPPPTPAPERDPSPDRLVPAEAIDLVAFPWGVLVGDPVAGSCEVRVRTTEGSIELALFLHDGDWTEVDRQTLVVDGPSAAHRFTGLVEGAAYCIVAFGGTGRSEVTRFRTAPAAGEQHVVHIGASSCFGRTNGGMPNLTYTADADLDVFLQVGDWCYADGAVTEAEYVDKWDSYQDREGPRALARATGIVHTWDDHEVSNNWTLEPGTDDSITQEHLEAGVAVWNQVIPRSEGQGVFGVWRSLKWGDIVELFVLDCRGERGPDGLLSEAQLAWFEDAMAASTAVFKLVLTSVHLTDHTELFSIVEQQDRWQGHPAQRARVVATCVNTPGTLVISGDMHFGAVQRVDPAGAPGADLWEVAAGASGSRIAPAAQIAEVAGFPAQYDLLLEAWTWCDLRLDPGTRQVSVDFIGDDGSVVANRELQL